jgi:hypothetical protein
MVAFNQAHRLNGFESNAISTDPMARSKSQSFALHLPRQKTSDVSIHFRHWFLCTIFAVLKKTECADCMFVVDVENEKGFQVRGKFFRN